MKKEKNRGFFSICQIRLIAIVLFLSSCSTFSKEQIQSIESFTTACDSFNRYPSLFFAEIAKIRIERGSFYAASLSNPENKINELNSIYEAFEKDTKLSSQCDFSLKILKSYSYALKVLTGDGRWKSRGVEFRSLGRAIDSLVVQANRLKIFENELPVGVAKSAAKIVAYGAETMLKRKQYKLTKAFVSEADTLVQSLVSGLIQTLRSPQLIALIENEREGLPLNYKSYLMSFSSSESTPFNSFEYDRIYLNLKERCDKLTRSRGYIISASNRLAKTHKELAKSIYNKKEVDSVFEQLSQLNEGIEILQKQFEVILETD